jgi:two-component system CheB/CheR fusion protein
MAKSRKNAGATSKTKPQRKASRPARGDGGSHAPPRAASSRPPPPPPPPPPPAAQDAGLDSQVIETLAPEPPAFPVVGIGASAGGLEACSQVLEHLPRRLEAALILVQHLSPRQESMLAELLGAAGHVPVVQVTDGMEIRPGRLHVIPPNTQMSIEDGGRLRLMPRPEDRSQYRPVDFFLRSLAAYAQSKAIGVVLSGTDADGAAGLREIKGVGGITIAQEPSTARYDGMPRSAIATGVVDLVLTPEQLAEELVRLSTHPYVRDVVEARGAGAGAAAAAATGARRGADGDGEDGAAAAAVTAATPSADDHLGRIFTIIRNATGVDFTHYKRPTIKRRLQRRMVLHKITSADHYIRFLQQHPGEVRELYQDILIHVTRFFRDPDTFKVLASKVFPELLANRSGTDQPVRIWVPGCSTGEEAYSIAITLLEQLGEAANSVTVQLFATDVSEQAIDHARAGVYPDSIATDVSAERLRRFFTRTDGSFKVAKTVRDCCVFARQDLTRDPPFSKLDLIVCRNVMIYLGPQLQKKLLSVFHYALKPGGYLMLGSAETIGGHSGLFAVADKRHRLYTKKMASIRTDLDLPHVDYAGERGGGGGGRRQAIEVRPSGNVQNEANRLILSRFSPPGVIVDSELRIVQFRGQTGAFLEPAPGEASLHLLKMAREGLLYGLRSALSEVRRNGGQVRKEGLRVKYNGHVRDVELEVIPLSPTAEGRHYLVLFQDVTPGQESPAARPQGAAAAAGGAAGKRAAKAKAPSGQHEAQHESKRVSRLQEELAASREYLQSIIQDLEAANEELQSANEEILSANEELQSTNEELDTAKEELQSTNEELNTVNEELQARNEELSHVNSDLVNLLGSVQIAIVMVASDLRIRRFTPMAEKLLNLIPTDVGRPISDIKPNIDCPDLEKLIGEAIDTVSTQEREVRDRHGNWLLLRIRPYKNVENRIDGAVLALFDVDTGRRQEMLLREAHDYAEGIIQTLREPMLVLDGELRVRTANESFYRAFRVAPDPTIGQRIYELGNGQWNIPRLRSLLEEVLPNAQHFEDFAVEHEFPEIGKRRMLLNARSLLTGDGTPKMILLAIEDVTGK